MRHEKISLADPVIIADVLAAIGDKSSSAVEQEADKGPPVALQHFYYCGRAPARRPAPVGKDGAAGSRGGTAA